jgi:hypothetical protein
LYFFTFTSLWILTPTSGAMTKSSANAKGAPSVNDAAKNKEAGIRMG